jgi:Tfp pilus assembly protein PilV
VETLVAITILVIAIVGPLYAVHKAIMASNVARDQLIATALAQEGLEYVRSVRDTNYLAGASWLNGLTSCSGTSGCSVDPHTASIAPCAGQRSGGCTPLRLSANKQYTQTQNVSFATTRFSRKVIITSLSPDEIDVAVTVSWTTLRTPYSVTVTEQLYNWL